MVANARVFWYYDRMYSFQKVKDFKDWQLGFVPSLITVLGLALGIHAMRYLFIGQITKAAVCILVAAVLDGFDGKVARYLNVSSKFGSTLDTLADFLNFGIVPGFMMYVKYFNAASVKLFWVSVVVFIACLALRLARFSVIGMEDEKFFKGVPAPGAAFLALFPIFFENAFPFFVPHEIMIGVSVFVLMATSFLMLSSFRTISLSRMQFSKKQFPILIIILCAAASLLHMYPWYFTIFVQAIYLFSVLQKKGKNSEKNDRKITEKSEGKK